MIVSGRWRTVDGHQAMRHSAWALAVLALPLWILPQTTGVVLVFDDIVDEFGEPSFNVDGLHWLGLFVDEDDSLIKHVEISWRRGDVGAAAFQLSTQPTGPLLLWTGVPQLEAAPAQTILRWTTDLSPINPMTTLQLNEAHYELALRGVDPGACDAVVILTDGGNSQQLYSLENGQFACDEPHLSVNWAGDLDGDGRLDLVTTFSRKYSYHPRRMYLSSAARPGELVGQVALFER